MPSLQLCSFLYVDLLFSSEYASGNFDPLDPFNPCAVATEGAGSGLQPCLKRNSESHQQLESL